MTKRNLFSALLLVATIVAAIVCYVIIFNNYDKIWFEFAPIFFLCLVTFLASIGIFISAILVEKKS